MEQKSRTFLALALVLGLVPGCKKEEGSGPTPKEEGAEATEEELIEDCRVLGDCEVATPLDRSVATTLWEAAQFLLQGDAPLQRDVEADILTRAHVSILTGRVEDTDGEPLLGARVSIVGHPEFGWTYSREDGQFQLAVNGGSRLPVKFEKTGRLPMQRSVQPAWNRYEVIPTVGLAPRSERATKVRPDSSSAQIAEADVVESEFGAHQPLVVFAPGTEATAHLPGGDESSLREMNVRVTEYPFELPSTAVEDGEETEEEYSRFVAATPTDEGLAYGLSFSVDEATELGAESVSFSKPVTVFVENFLEMEVGSEIPFNYFDESAGVWEQQAPLVAIEILDEAWGHAEVDVDGDGEADDAEALEELGLTDVELQALADRYEPGQSLWTTQVEHFSSYQGEFPVVPPPSASAPGVAVPQVRPLATTSVRGSVRVETQAVMHDVALAGTPFSLHYQSDRTSDSRADYEIEVPLIGEEVPQGLVRVRAEVQVAGRRFRRKFSPEENLSHTFTWDGRDELGRLVQGQQRAKVIVSYDYPGNVRVRKRNRASWGTAQALQGENRTFSTLVQKVEIPVGNWDASGYELGGFGVNHLHAYDPVNHTLHYGDGTAKYSQNIALVVDRPGKNDDLGFPDSITIAPDGSAYVTDDDDGRIFRITGDEEISVVAGSGAEGDAEDLPIEYPQGVVYLNDGSLIVADYSDAEIWRLSPSGEFQALVGKSDEDPSIEADFEFIEGIALGPNDELYFVAGSEVYRVRGEEMELFAGGGEETSDGAAAVESSLNKPSGIAIGPDGTVYISETDGHRVRKISPNGTMFTVAGTGEAGFSGDGEFAGTAQLESPKGLALGVDGSLYIADYGNNRIRLVTPDGRIQTIAGGTETAVVGSQVAREVSIDSPDGIAIDGEGVIWVSGSEGLFRIRPGTPKLGTGETLIPSTDGHTLYRFDERGKHLETIDAMTAVVQFRFEYDNRGLLRKIFDRDGLDTDFERSGGKLERVVGYFGHVTEVDIEVEGEGKDEVVGTRLSKVTDQLGRTEEFTYDDETGLLEIVDTPEGQTMYDYRPNGRVMSVTDPTGYVETYDRSRVPGGHSVQVTTASDKVAHFMVTNLPGGLQERSIVGFDGETRAMSDHTMSQTLYYPDGSTRFTSLRSDPHFGAQSVYADSLVTNTPGGRTMTISPRRLKEFDDPEDALSVTEWTEEFEINGRLYQSTYNRDDHTLTTITPEGRTTVSTFDQVGRQIVRRDPGLAVRRWTYNSLGQTTLARRGTASSGRDVTIGWGNHGWPTHFTNDLGETTVRHYDEVGRVFEVTRPDETFVRTDWNDDDTVDFIKLPSGQQHYFSYLEGLLEHSTPPDVDGDRVGRVSYSYDDENRVTQIKNGDGRTLNMSYDSAGRLSSTEIESGTVSFQYDNMGQIRRALRTGMPTLNRTYDGPLLAGENWGNSRSVDFGYDDNFWMTQITVNKALTTHFVRDDDGLLTEARVQRNTMSITRDPESGFVKSTSLANVDTFVDYNKYGETKSLQVDAPELAYAQDISRDPLGRIAELTETIDGVETNYSFVYDELGQLTRYVKNGEVHSYTYDVNGNRLSYTDSDGVVTEGVYDEQDRVETWGEWTFAHSEQGDLYQRFNDETALTLHYDELGNLLQAEAAENDTNLTVDYKVDAMGRRVARGSSTGDWREWVYQDELRPVGEIAGGIFSQFVYANDGVGGAPDFMVRSATADVYQFVKDHVGSVRFVVDANSGEVVQELEYDPFGRVLFDSNPGFQPFGFAGGLYDWETKLVRFGARDYDPGIGRWVAKDPIGFAGGQTNVYVYVGNDPVNGVDPTGMFLNTAWDVAVQAARGAWTSPQLAVGLLVGVLGSGFDAAVVNGNLEFYDNGITSGLSAATTFGQVIVYSYPERQIAPSLRAHEQQHVPQSDVLGPAYLPAHIFNQGFFEYGLGFDHHVTPLERGPSNQSNPNPWGL